MNPRPTHYPRVWERSARELPVDILPTSIINETEAAEICGVSQRTLARHRQAGTGPETLPPGSYFGNAIRYVAWKVVSWRNNLVGNGPVDLQGIGQAWLLRLDRFPSTPRGPLPRPPGIPPGTDPRELKRQLIRKLKADLAQLGATHAQACWNAMNTIN